MRLAALIAELNRIVPPSLAEDWDSIGLICGDWSAEVQSALLSVDIDERVLDEAVAGGHDIVLSHHPLALPRHTSANAPHKLRTAARANTHGIALFNLHTNADAIRPGVSDAIADALGVRDTLPLAPNLQDPLLGIGRVGDLDSSITLAEFRSLIDRAVPGARSRVSGNGNQKVRRVAICGGAGDSLLDAARLHRADVYVTSDLRHHPVAEFQAAGGGAVIDIDHVAAERMWLPVFAQMLAPLPLRVSIGQVDTSNWV